MRRCAATALACLLASGTLHAEMAGDEYQTGAGALTEEELASSRARLSEEIAAERARAEDARRRAEAEAERVAAQRAARPLGERLVDMRCLTCHDEEQIAQATFGTPGWTLTVMRMEWLNGARLESGERSEIVAHLAARHPERNRSEWVMVMGGVAAAALAGLGAMVRRSRRWAARHET